MAHCPGNFPRFPGRAANSEELDFICRLDSALGEAGKTVCLDWMGISVFRCGFHDSTWGGFLMARAAVGSG